MTRRCRTLAIAVAAALPLAVFAAPDMTDAAGPQAAQILQLWRITVLVCSAVFAAILVALLAAVGRAPRSGADAPADVSGLLHDEPGPRRSVIGAVGVSTVLLLLLLLASVTTDRALAHLVLRDAIHIELTAHQWWWSARYDDEQPSRMFTTANELHIPVGRPVILTLNSDDVIHSLWVPQLAGKKDLIPGRSATLTWRADRAGTYRGQCAEFCGAQHAWMALSVSADPPDQYEAWAAQQRAAAATPSEARTLRGQQVFLGASCVMCHAISGTDAGAQHAPDLSHVGSRGTLGAGALPNDDAHLAAWIGDPQAHKPGVNMPGTAFAQDDLQALVAYLRSLR